ncbi:MAG: small basic family protein [Clostridia bacterium]
MIFIAILIGCVVGALIGVNIPTIPYTYSGYLAIAIIAALDSVFGAITSTLNKNFNMKIFISGFFVNAILAMALTYLGQKLNVDIYLAAVVVFVWRMFNNLGTIRRYYVDKFSGSHIIAKAEATIKKLNQENKKEGE